MPKKTLVSIIFPLHFTKTISIPVLTENQSKYQIIAELYYQVNKQEIYVTKPP